MRHRYIIGFGTGRCGTMSLATLLDGCRHCAVMHEFNANVNRLPWNFSRAAIDRKVEALRGLDGSVVGDVALYYLNYIPYIMRNLPNARAIWIWRNLRGTFRSWQIKLGGIVNSFNDSPADWGYYKDGWSACFPKFSALRLEDALRLYLRVYREIAEHLMEYYPDRIIRVDIRNLNKRDIQEHIFEFAGIEPRNRRYREVHENRRQPCKYKASEN